ncbi:MAG: hypothetical protein JW837_07020 [Sedimentisphaerales bacterium]|nr:hypothetical protein [Sedimentisphaerales bacterium]
MKKLNILVLLSVVFTCGSIYATEKNSCIPTEDQVQRLAAAAWKEQIKYIDVTFYEYYTKKPEPLEQIRKRAKEFADRELNGRSLNELTTYEIERRNQIIEANFKIGLENQKFPRKIKKRVRISDDKQRVDMVKVGPNEPLGPDTPFVHTFINTKDAHTGDFVSYHYASDMNTVFVDTSKWAKEPIAKFTDMSAARSLQISLGVDKGGTITSPIFAPDPNKMQALARTGLTKTESIAGVKLKRPLINKISICPDPNAPDTKDIIRMGDPNHFPSFVSICDKKDYSRVYRTEFHIPKTNRIRYIYECDNFNSNGFPHNITEIQYDKDGKLEQKSVYKIIKIELNPSMPAEVFEFHPPEGYKVVDYRTKTPQ